MKSERRPEDLTAEEMRNLHAKVMRRVLWLNGLWIIFVLFMLFWMTRIGLILAALTAVKYYFDFRDVESQSVASDFEHQMIKKELIDKLKDD